MLANEKMADVYISHRVNGETFRAIAERYSNNHTTIADMYARACIHITEELEKELTRHRQYAGHTYAVRQGRGSNIPTVFYVDGSTHKYTFTLPAVRPFVLSHCRGLVLNVFAGPTLLSKEGCQFVRNDTDPAIEANFHIDAASPEFVYELKKCGLNEFDTVLLDPPFSAYLAKRKYNSQWFRDYTLVKNNIDQLTKVGAKVISLGFNSTGMGRTRGYAKQELLVVNCKGNSNDILVLVETKMKHIPREEDEYVEIESPRPVLPNL
jgi:hypothetical protein